MDTISFTPLSNVRPFLYQFLRNSQLIDNDTWRSSTPNFIRNDKKGKHSILQSKYDDWYCTDFHESHTRPHTFCKEILYRISWKSGKLYCTVADTRSWKNVVSKKTLIFCYFLTNVKRNRGIAVRRAYFEEQW